MNFVERYTRIIIIIITAIGMQHCTKSFLYNSRNFHIERVTKKVIRLRVSFLNATNQFYRVSKRFTAIENNRFK